MKSINKRNIGNFMNYYHNFHDSNIISISYNIKDARIVAIINVCWSGIPMLNEDKTYHTNEVMIKMVFHNVLQYNNREMNNGINKAYLKYIKFNDREMLCFADSVDKPLFYVVCDTIEYEEVGLFDR